MKILQIAEDLLIADFSEPRVSTHPANAIREALVSRRIFQNLPVKQRKNN